jgi:hypothetical protein
MPLPIINEDPGEMENLPVEERSSIICYNLQMAYARRAMSAPPASVSAVGAARRPFGQGFGHGRDRSDSDKSAPTQAGDPSEDVSISAPLRRDRDEVPAPAAAREAAPFVQERDQTRQVAAPLQPEERVAPAPDRDPVAANFALGQAQAVAPLQPNPPAVPAPAVPVAANFAHANPQATGQAVVTIDWDRFAALLREHLPQALAETIRALLYAILHVMVAYYLGR